MPEPALLRNETDGIIDVVLNRPDKLNAINREILDGLRLAVQDLAERTDLRVLLIRAKGRYFSSGADLADLRTGEFDESPARARHWFRREMGGMQSLWQEMELVEKPIVVAHHAPCVGGGLEMSLSCDFRLAAASASYVLPELKMAMLPLSGGISRLTRLCGPHWARWMVLANKPVTAERALTMGLVHEVYPDASFEREVLAFCRTLAAQPPDAMAAAKLAIELASDLESAQARQVERITFSSLALSREHVEMAAQHRLRILGNAREAEAAARADAERKGGG